MLGHYPQYRPITESKLKPSHSVACTSPVSTPSKALSLSDWPVLHVASVFSRNKYPKGTRDLRFIATGSSTPESNKSYFSRKFALLFLRCAKCNVYSSSGVGIGVGGGSVTFFEQALKRTFPLICSLYINTHALL